MGDRKMTSAEWWEGVKSDPEHLAQWLRRQYVGELAAVNLLSELLIRFGSQASDREWITVHKVMCQEAQHGRWIKGLMDSRGIAPESDATTDRRYWAEVLPHVNSFAEGCAAGFHAESMRLQRIRAIANDEQVPTELVDIQHVFRNILPDEEWHETAFDEMRNGLTLTRYHEAGLEALNLVMA